VTEPQNEDGNSKHRSSAYIGMGALIGMVPDSDSSSEYCSAT
jgi:hypothetical protein